MRFLPLRLVILLMEFGYIFGFDGLAELAMRERRRRTGVDYL